MNPTLSTIVDTLGLGAAVGGAGTINRAIAGKLTSLTGGDTEGLGRKAVEFIIPAIAIGAALNAAPATAVGVSVARLATMAGSMALVEASAGAVRTGMTLFGFKAK